MTLARNPFLSGGLAVAGLTAVALSLACGGGASGVGTATPTSQPAVMNLTISDASTEDWATIGVKILSIGLIPQGGTAAGAVTVFAAPTPAPAVNLVQLDQLSEILGNLTVPAGTYTGAVLTISGNPGDVSLVASADPEAGFALAAGTSVPSNRIQIQGTTGTAPNLTVPVTVNLVSPLVATAGQSTALDLEFDLAHPAFIVEHLTAADSGVPFWAVNFNGPLRHHPAAVTDLVLRHLYGTVTGVSTDDTTLTVTKDFPTMPPANPETEQSSSLSLPILADATNGTFFYDLDTKTAPTVIDNFSSVASVLANGEFVRVAARYQENGTLVATRIWASSTFNNVYVSPEGHVLHVNGSAATPNIVVQNELGLPVVVDVNAATEFFYRTPADGQTDAASIQGANGGITFLTNDNLVRGFKVHVGVVDPLANPLVAQTVDIETARYDGTLSAPVLSPAGFTDTRNFNTHSDDYTKALVYISSASANGTVPGTSTVIDGFKWWDFAYPISSLQDGATGESDFATAIGGSVTFGGTPAINMLPWGFNFATWGDAALPTGWAVKTSILAPTQLPLGTVANAWSGTSDSFGMTLPGGVDTVNVDLDVTSGSATLVYQVDRKGNVVTVTPQDITTATGLANTAGGLTSTAPVKVYGIPQADGSIKAYVLFYYTNVKPTA